MAKFVIECPECGRYAQAKTGFFARKRIDCACGNVINVRTDKLSSRVCPHCGNSVVFDQRKGDKALCPVCQEPINTVALQAQNVEFTCQQCGVALTVPKGTATYACPVCDHVNDVTERVKLAKIKSDGQASIIAYEGDDETLVWKHPVENFNYGSQLVVRESQEAIFLRDGHATAPLKAGRYALETQQLPQLQELVKHTPVPGGTFQSEVYFVNMATQMAVKWGTDTKVGLFDPMTGMHAEIGASGEFNIRIADSRKFLLKVVGTSGGFRQEQLMGSNGKGYFRSMVMTRVKSYLAAAIKEKNISVLELDERLMELSEALREQINPGLAEYGLEMSEFFVARVLTPDTPEFKAAKKQFAARYLGNNQAQLRREISTANAQTDAQLKIIQAQADAEVQRLKAAAEADSYRMKAHAEADEMRMKGYSYRDETARQVSLEAMQNGITGNGATGVLGDMASIGMSMGVMSGVMDMTREAVSQSMGGGSGWDCVCGHKGVTSNFCPDCGKPKPAAGWSCACGQQGITSNFCPNCGTKKPDPVWNCPNCGQQEVRSNFCPNCGFRKP